MFTGIIQNTGVVKSIEKPGDTRIVIDTAMDLSKTPIGASICCSGVCLTVVQKEANCFAVDVSDETLDKSGIGLWTTGTRINLEPSLKLGDELGGHFVFGHVDGQVMVKSIKDVGDSHVVTFTFETESKGRIMVSTGNEDFIQMIAPKGSVTLDGVSLTANEVSQFGFTVNIIPHTWENTTLGQLQVGDKLNIEIDMLARYVARMLGRFPMRSAA